MRWLKRFLVSFYRLPSHYELLCRIVFQLEALSILGGRIMARLDELEAAVTKSTDVEKSAIILIQGIAQALKDAGTDPIKIADLVGKLNAGADDLAAAIVANTPAAQDEPPPAV